MKRDFIVTSHGWSASNWLAFALNKHPEILCTHSARNIVASAREMNSNENLRRHLKTLHQGYVSRQNESLDNIYATIEGNGSARLYGSVHVVRLRDLPIIYEKFGPSKRFFNIINLIRHPISLVWSGYGQFQELFRYDLNELHWTSGKVLKYGKEFIYQLADKYEINVGELENLAFLGASAVLSSLRLDFDAEKRLKDIPNVAFHGHIKMEEVTKQPKQLKQIISLLSEGELSTQFEYIEDVYRSGIVNQHKSDPNKRDAEKRYAQFSAWQKEAFVHFLNCFDLRKEYEKIGYDLGFI